LWQLRWPYRQNEAKLWNKGQARTDPIQNEEEQVLSQLFGAVLRAVLVFFVIATPSLVFGDTSRGDVEGVMLFGLIAALFVVFEYSARHPAIIEFRDAPPYNRLRILALFSMLFLLSLVSADPVHLQQFNGPEGAVSTMVNRAHHWGGVMFDIGLSHLSPDYLLQRLFGAAPLSVQAMDHVRIMAALALTIALGTLFIFALFIRFSKWPGRGMSINMWVNLPMFDPTVGSDVTHRLKCDTRRNIIWGLGLPLILPPVLGAVFSQTGSTLAYDGQGAVWVVTLWAFLPMCLLIRAMALLRLRYMIRSYQKRIIAALTPDERLALS